MTDSHHDVRLAAVEPSQWPILRELATTIWRECYAAIITPAQINFMLSERFSDESLARLTADAEQQLAVLWLGARAVGYCGSGPGGEPGVQKLGQLYLLAEMRGRGLGRLMLADGEPSGSCCRSINRIRPRLASISGRGLPFARRRCLPSETAS
jgi:GNAT superfamily N-acetyltransferase